MSEVVEDFHITVDDLSKRLDLVVLYKSRIKDARRLQENSDSTVGDLNKRIDLEVHRRQKKVLYESRKKQSKMSREVVGYSDSTTGDLKRVDLAVHGRQKTCMKAGGSNQGC